MKIATVTVIGANGTMGCNVSAIFASFGNAKVYMVSRDIEKSRASVVKASKSVRAESIIKNIVPADYTMLEKCISESDLIFESVAENIDVKKEITLKIAKYLRKDTIIASGTSGLSITTLAELLPDEIRCNYFGIHMFNPPYSMVLCEVTPTKYTNRKLFEDVKKYLADTLYRTVVEVKDSPAFLGNRIGFQFINEALQYAEKYKYNGGIDYIDSILGPFTGRAMAPLATSDFVGLDVHKAIVDNLYINTSDYAHHTFILPEFAEKLIKKGKLGRKTKGGLYRMVVDDSGSKRLTVYDITTDTYRDKIKYSFPFIEKMVRDLQVGDYKSTFLDLLNNHSIEAEICLSFLLKYVIYSLNAAEEVGYDIHSADDVMATGFNWCPPLALIKAFSEIADFKELVHERLDKQILESIDIDKLLTKTEPSKYDYRLYFKSIK